MALRMKRPDLPVYYYHDHFVEMPAFVRATYGSILTDEHDVFVNRFEHLSKDAECLLIRMVNRRGTIFIGHCSGTRKFPIWNERPTTSLRAIARKCARWDAGKHLDPPGGNGADLMGRWPVRPD
jgi:hypothetical protein